MNKAATGKEEKPEGNFEDARSGQSFAVQSDEHLVKAIGKEHHADPGSLLRAAPRLLGDPDVSTRPTAGTTSRHCQSRTSECRDGVTLVSQAEKPGEFT